MSIRQEINGIRTAYKAASDKISFGLGDPLAHGDLKGPLGPLLYKFIELTLIPVLMLDYPYERLIFGTHPDKIIDKYLEEINQRKEQRPEQRPF